MGSRSVLAKGLAIVGTVLVWCPLLAPVLFAVMAVTRGGIFHIDYLMPAELFPVALVGGVLLLWAALRARSRRGLIGWSLGLAAAFLVIGQALAVVTGLASGATAPTGWQGALVVASLVAFSLALIMLAVGGILLLRDLFRAPRP
jgi:hypothetical protein